MSINQKLTMKLETFDDYARFYDNPFKALYEYRYYKYFHLKDHQDVFYRSIPDSFIDRCAQWVATTDETDSVEITRIENHLRVFLHFRDDQRLKDALVHVRLIASIRRTPTYEQCL